MHWQDGPWSDGYGTGFIVVAFVLLLLAVISIAGSFGNSIVGAAETVNDGVLMGDALAHAFGALLPAVIAAAYGYRLLKSSNTNVQSVSQPNLRGELRSEATSVKTVANADLPPSANISNHRFGVSEQNEEAFWALALAEFESMSRRPGLWAKLFAEAKGNEAIAKANYLSERVTELKEESLLNTKASENAVRNAQSEVDAIACFERFRSGQAPTIEEVVFMVHAINLLPDLARTADRIRGETLLHWCARLNLMDEAMQLLGKGADPAAQNGSGQKAFQLAKLPSLVSALRATSA